MANFFPNLMYCLNVIVREPGTWTAVLGLATVVLPLWILKGIWVATGNPAQTIARATTTEAIRQPVFSLMIMLCMVVNLLNAFIPFFTLGEDVKMMKDCVATLMSKN